MPIGVAEFDPFAVSLAGLMVPTVVSRYDPAAGLLFPLPNVVCESVSARVGAEPWSARFRYMFDQRLDASLFPRTFEQVFALSLPGVWSGSPYVVKHEDRLVVRAGMPDGTWEVLFDGFARLPQVDYGKGELVTFEAIGTPERAWDYPVPGALVRDASDTQEGEATWTNLPTRFNPDGLANCTPEGFDYEVAGPLGGMGECPIFVDEKFLARFTPEELADEEAPVGRKWSLAAAARYLIVGGNVDEDVIVNPDLDALDTLLSSVRPAEGFAYIDWRDSTTYELSPVIAQDLDVTGMAWPEALEALLKPHGFTMAFDLRTTAAGLPQWHLIIRRNDDNTYWKILGLQRHGEAFDPALNAVGAASLQRDGLVANEVVVDTGATLKEASFVLAPLGWSPDPEDADDAEDAESKWKKGTATFDPVKYRVFGLDECGEGHWDFVAEAEDTTPADLSAIFPDDDDEERTYAHRPRPGSMALVTTDLQGKRLKAELWIKALDDYAGPVPGVWDGDTEGWQRVTASGWKLLPDRLGIVVDCANARSWEVTKDGDKPVLPGGVLDLVKAMADPTSDNSSGRRVVFRLTTVVETDIGETATATKREQSPSRYTVQRRVDARDRFRNEIITTSSHLNTTEEDILARDDADDALAYAESLRRENEAIKFAGTLSVPRLSTYVRLCDKVIGLAGRDLELASYQPGTSEGPRYPMVVGLDWSLDRPQGVRILLADYRGETAGGIDWSAFPEFARPGGVTGVPGGV